jgi:hypothetical protein
MVSRWTSAADGFSGNAIFTTKGVMRMTVPESPPPEMGEATKNGAPTFLSNSERLRSHLTKDGLALTLIEAWKKDDPEAQARMLAAIHDFHKPK